MAISIRQRIERSATPFLHQGETVQAAFGAQTTRNPFLGILILMLTNAYRAIVITDQRIIVFKTRRSSPSTVTSVVRELPRTTPLPVPTGKWLKTEAFGERLFVYRRFFKDIEKAAGVGKAPRPPFNPD